MYIKSVVIGSLLMGLISTQVEMNYSYELQYGNGAKVTKQESLNPDTTDYSYFENILDINTYYGDNIYIHTQIEYSNPPVFGYDRTGIDSIISALYIEYSYDRFNLKLGDLYALYGRGLSLYIFQDQAIDYGNSIKGLAINYFLNDNLKITSLVGAGKYAFRSNPANRKTDYQFKTNAILGMIDYDTQLFGYF